jgi:hypothetical protein
MVENFDEFYEDFYKPQFEWYDTKAISNKKYHRGMKISQIVLAAILPVAVTLFPVTASSFWQTVIIVAAVLLVILEALESYLNYQKKWMNYRTTAEGLRREEQMFKTGTKEYEDAENPEKLFVERVMALTSQENRYWEITTRKAQEA